MITIIIKIIISLIFSLAPWVAFLILSMGIDDFLKMFMISGISDLMADIVSDIKSTPWWETVIVVLFFIAIIVSIIAGLISSLENNEKGLGNFILFNILIPLGISFGAFIAWFVFAMIFWAIVEIIIGGYLGLGLGLLALLFGGGTVVCIVVVKK